MRLAFSDRHRGRHATALLAIVAIAGCSVPIDTGLGAPKKAIETADPAPAVAEPMAAGEHAYQTGNAEDGARLIEKAEEATEKNPGDKPRLADTLTDLAVEQTHQGNPQEALELHERALRLREDAFGNDGADVAESLNFLGATYYQLQRYDDAERAFARALAIRQKALGPDDRLTGLSMNNLAFFYAARGDYDRADPLFVDSIRIIDAANDATWAEKSRALDNYAAMLHDAGRSDEAAEIEKRAATYRSKRRQIMDIMEATRERGE